MAVARQAAVEEVLARVGEIVLAAAERVLGREIRASDHQDLIDEAIAAVQAESTTGAPQAAGGTTDTHYPVSIGLDPSLIGLVVTAWTTAETLSAQHDSPPPDTLDRSRRPAIGTRPGRPW